MIGSYVPVQISRNGAGRSYTVSFQQHLTKHHVRGIQEGCTFYKRWNTKYVVNAASGQPLESEPGASSPKSTLTPVKNALDAFYRFSRPHTVIGTVKFNFDKQILQSYIFVLNLYPFLCVDFICESNSFGLILQFPFLTLEYWRLFFKQALSIISVSLLAVEKLSDFSPLFFTGVLEVMLQVFLSM